MTTASRVENGKSDQVSKSKDTVVDGGISLLSPASMGGFFSDSRTSAFQPNLLRTNRDVKSIDYKALSILIYLEITSKATAVIGKFFYLF